MGKKKDSEPKENTAINDELRILDDFARADYEAWKNEVELSLKGKPFESLISKSYEGIAIKPLYNRDDFNLLTETDNKFPGMAPFIRGIDNAGYKHYPWHIAQEFAYPGADAMNSALKHDLGMGQNAVMLSLDYATSAMTDPSTAKEDEIGYNGTSVCFLKDIENVFKDIDIAKYPVYIKNAVNPLPPLALLAAYLKNKGIGKLTGGILSDPLAWLEENGSLPYSADELFNSLSEMIKWAGNNLGEYRLFTVDASLYNECGANAVQELAFSMAKGVHYLRKLQSEYLPVDAIAPRMMFRYAAGPEFFMEIAKFRAARLLWARIVKEFGGSEDSQKMFIFAGTCKWNKSKLDAHTNLLRATSETLAAILGGCNAVNTGNFDAAFGLPTEFSRRIARNIQIILKEECNLTDTVDPAAGSWYLETLVSELANKAWELFRSIEQEGGFCEAVKKGIIKNEIDKTKKDRMKNLFSRKDILVGVNKYSNMNEKTVESEQFDIVGFARTRVSETATYIMNRGSNGPAPILEKIKNRSGNLNENLVSAVQAGATIGELAGNLFSGQDCATIEHTISPENLTIGFEYLRANAEAYKAVSGKAPEVFLAAMGPVKQHKGRVDFAMDYFRVGGFEPLYSQGFDTVEQAAEAFFSSKAGIAVLCSTDDTYDELVPAFTQLVKTRDKNLVVILAGYPKDRVEDYRKAGVNDFIHVRSDIFETLKNLQKAVGLIS